MQIYDFTLESNAGETISLQDFAGKVLLIVNTATRCGFTPQYKALQALYDAYKDRGFEIIEVPCNQFLSQAPGTDAEIQNFCTVKYKTTFLRTKKADVNGENALPLFNYLKSEQGFQGFGSGLKAMGMSLFLRHRDWNYKENAEIKWNFTKFLVDRKGHVVGRFEPTADMAKLQETIEKLLA